MGEIGDDEMKNGIYFAKEHEGSSTWSKLTGDCLFKCLSNVFIYIYIYIYRLLTNI